MYEKKNTTGKTGPWVYVEFTVIGILILIIAAMLVIYFSFRETGSAPKLFGYYIYQTHAVNMEPIIPAESAVFAKADDAENIVENSVVLCRIDNNLTIIKVVEELEENGEIFYIVRFETSPANDTYKIPAESVIARAVYYDKFTGSLLNFATSEKGIIIVVIIPSILIVLFQVIKIVLAQRSNDEDEEVFGTPIPTGDAVESESSGGDDLGYRELPPVRVRFDTSASEKQLNSFKVGMNGAAVYEPAPKGDSILVTEEQLDEMSGKKSNENSSLADSFANQTVKIPEEEKAEKSIFDELMNGVAGGNSETVINLSDVIPDKIAQIKTSAYPDEYSSAEMTSAKSRRSERTESAYSDPSVKTPAEFYSLEPQNVIPPDESDKPILNTDSIPKDSVAPKEKIAPKRKQSSNKTIEELMGIIDQQQAKIKRTKQ